MAKTYTPKINYNECDCGHDWLMHNNTLKANIMLIGGIILLILIVFIPIITIQFLQEIPNNILYIGLTISILIFGTRELSKYVFSMDRFCDLCSCNKFESNPHPYSTDTRSAV
jgi:uncharacterized membrane protein